MLVARKLLQIRTANGIPRPENGHNLRGDGQSAPDCAEGKPCEKLWLRYVACSLISLPDPLKDVP